MFARCPTTEDLARRRQLLRRSAWTLVALAAIGALTWKAITAPDGVADPTAPGAHLSHGAVVVDSALLVFREGLEAATVVVGSYFMAEHVRVRRPRARAAAAA